MNFNQALFDIISGLAICSDQTWVQDQLDYLLREAAEIDPDTSVIHDSVAYAHASGGRWDDAEDTVGGIADPSIRDKALKEICAMVLETTLADKMQYAISFVSNLSIPLERGRRLVALAFYDALLDDLLVYGQLVGLFTEFPEKQKEVVAYVSKKRPDIVERTVSNKTESDQAKLKRIPIDFWMQTIQRLAPESYTQIIQELKNSRF